MFVSLIMLTSSLIAPWGPLTRRGGPGTACMCVGAPQPKELAPASLRSQRPLLHPLVHATADPAICHMCEGDRALLHVRIGSALLWVFSARIWVMQMLFSLSLPLSLSCVCQCPEQTSWCGGRGVGAEAHQVTGRPGPGRALHGAGECQVQEGGRVSTYPNRLDPAGHLELQ